MVRLFQHAQVMVMREVTLPVEEQPLARVDFLGVDGTAMARRLAADLASRRPSATSDVVFEAHGQPRRSLWDVAQNVRFH